MADTIFSNFGPGNPYSTRFGSDIGGMPGRVTALAAPFTPEETAVLSDVEIPLVKLSSNAPQYPETRASAFALHDQYPNADGLTWTSRQADPARALVLFEDRLTGPALTASGTPTSLLLSDGSAILEVLKLAQRLGVLLTP